MDCGVSLEEMDVAAFDECDACIAMYRSRYDEMFSMLKESPDDIPEVLSHIINRHEVIPAFAEAYPEHRETLKTILKQKIEEIEAADEYYEFLNFWEDQLQDMKSIYARL